MKLVDERVLMSYESGTINRLGILKIWKQTLKTLWESVYFSFNIFPNIVLFISIKI